MEHLSFAGNHVVASTPEGKRESLPIEDFCRILSPEQVGTGDVVLPDRVCAVRSRGSSIVWVHQSPPARYNLRWIADDSPEPFGPNATYRDVTIALPYVIVLVVFEPGPGGHTVSQWNECFFRTAPLTSVRDELCFPALLNCSKFDPPDGRPLAWICTQHLDRSSVVGQEPAEQLRRGYSALLRCLFETAFNRSSEMHEGSSWYEVSRGVDDRIATIDAWQAASTDDPAFVLDVPWLPTGETLSSVIERTFEARGDGRYRVRTADALARMVLRGAQRARLHAKAEAVAESKKKKEHAKTLVQNLFGTGA